MDKLVQTATVTYADVDRHERIALARLFKVLQEAAIVHANQFGAGTNALARGETWVLNRIAAEIARYPVAGETLQVETWSTGVKAFKGWRDFRVYDGTGGCVVHASSLWLYANAATKALIRVPRDLAERFPVGADAAWCPELDRLPLTPPPRDAEAFPATLRYSDFDLNQHVNNAAYLDLLQTALVLAGGSPHPSRVVVNYVKAIAVEGQRVTVRIGPAAPLIRFAIESEDGTLFVQGEASPNSAG